MLKRIYRLTKKKEFDNVFKNGKSSFNKVVGIKHVNNNKNFNRFGIIVSTKISKKAVERNKIKRQIREVIKTISDQTKKGYDIVLITQPPILKEPFQKIKENITQGFKKLQLLK